MLLSRKAFTLVEMLVALAVSSIVIIATYASYDMVKTQYEKNIDIADMHTSGRAIMRIIERDVRMAGYEHRTSLGNKTFSASITNQLVLSESNNTCCDGISVIYDHSTDATDGVERRRITYSVREFPGTEEIDYKLLDSDVTRYRLYKKIDALGRDGAMLSPEESGTERVLVDFVDDLQIVNIVNTGTLYSGRQGGNTIETFDPVSKAKVSYIRDTGRIDALAFDSNGFLYSGRQGGNTIETFDPVSKAKVSYIRDTGRIDALAFGSDGLLYAGYSSGSTINIYNVASKEKVGYIRDTGRIDALAFGSDGLLYAGYGGGSTINIYNVASKAKVGYIRDTGRIDALAFGSDGLLYAGYGGGSTINIYNVASKAKVGYIRDTGRIDALAFKNKSTGQESLVNIKLTLRSKNKQHTKDKTYTKEADEEHHVGNYNFEFNDQYKRDVFFSTVAVRNMLL